MKVYFLRHGVAEELSASGSDASRRLTEGGADEMRRVARGMRALGLRFDIILTSPFLRARETADFVAEALKAKEILREEADLASGATEEGIMRLLLAFPPRHRVLLVGHEPDCSEAISALMGGGAVRMKKASLACLDWPNFRLGGAELRWLLEAEQLSALAEA